MIKIDDINGHLASIIISVKNLIVLLDVPIIL